MFVFLKSKKLHKEIEELRAKLDNINLTIEQTKYLDLNKEINELKDLKEGLEYEIDILKSAKIDLESKLNDLRDNIDIQSYGFYEPKYDFKSSQEYKIRLEDIRKEQKDLIKKNLAIESNCKYSIEDDNNKGINWLKNVKKLLLKAFNCECDNIISRVKYNNVELSVGRINKVYAQVNDLTSISKIYITNEYLCLKIEELYLKYEYECKKQEEKEEQYEIRERMREEAKVLKEIELAKKRIEKEEAHFKNAIAELMVKIETANSIDKPKLLNELKYLEAKLEELEKEKENVLNREKNNRAGYVYIISNIGSFGENIYKIGMTRRLEPYERIRELSSASVPFKFDIHAMIFSEDAPDLEYKLHKRFAENQVNKVNPRKEFFNISLKEIETVVNSEFGKPIEFTKLAEAEEYRKSLLMNSNKINIIA